MKSPHTGKRIVSLVPSLTETLCRFGLIDSVVACTSFCVEPRELRSKVPSVGGTKDPRMEEIIALKPTHVVVNSEENTTKFIDQLNVEKDKSGFEVLETFIEKPEDNFALVTLLGKTFDFSHEAKVWVDHQKNSLLDLRKNSKNLSPFLYSYFIWMNPWMVAGDRTYIASTLALVGGTNTISTSSNLDERYPAIEARDDRLSNANVLLFSSEPYPFKNRHIEEFRRQSELKQPMLKVDGQALSWYGSRFEQTLQYLGRLREEIQKSLD